MVCTGRKEREKERESARGRGRKKNGRQVQKQLVVFLQQ